MIENMTLRDYFAAKAMQGIVSAEFSKGIDDYTIAESAFMIADAMLHVREQDKEMMV